MFETGCDIGNRNSGSVLLEDIFQKLFRVFRVFGIDQNAEIDIVISGVGLR